MARIIVFIFGIVLFIASCISMNRCSMGTHTTAVITAVSNVRKMYSSNRNPPYRDYYEEDVTVTYDDDKTGNLIVKERFKQQLPAVGDDIPVLVSKSGKVTEETTESLTKSCFIMLFGIFLVVLGIVDKK